MAENMGPMQINPPDAPITSRTPIAYSTTPVPSFGKTVNPGGAADFYYEKMVEMFQNGAAFQTKLEEFLETKAKVKKKKRDDRADKESDPAMVNWKLRRQQKQDQDRLSGNINNYPEEKKKVVDEWNALDSVLEATRQQQQEYEDEMDQTGGAVQDFPRDTTMPEEWSTEKIPQEINVEQDLLDMVQETDLREGGFVKTMVEAELVDRISKKEKNTGLEEEMRRFEELKRKKEKNKGLEEEMRRYEENLE